MKKSAVLLNICLLVCLIGCRSGEETAVSQLPTPVPVPTETAVPPTLTPSATPLPATSTAIPPTQTPTATATPSPTATPDFSCPKPGGNATLETSLDFPEFPEKLVAYLNQVGTIEQLPEQLEALNIEYDIFPVDMNDDDALEFVLNVAIPPEGEMAFPGDRGTAILQCRNGSYEVILDIWSGIYRFFRYTFSDDVDNDGNQDVIIVGGFDGSACDLEPKVFIYSESEIIDASPDYRELEMGCSHEDMVLTEDIDGDGTKELIVSGRTVSHLDYAPPRTIIQTFALQDKSYVLQATELGPPEYLVHLLDDAQRALDNGDLLTAAQLYESVAQNQSLATIYSYKIGHPQTAEERGIEPDHPQEYQQAFALFRLAALHVVLENPAQADVALAQLQERFSEGIPGNEFNSLAVLLVDSLREGNSTESSCKIVLQEIKQNYPELERHYYWGWNIAWYSNETICPFTEPFYQ